MYSLKELHYALQQPTSIQREALRKTVFRSSPNGENFLDKDWDTLVILDACRYDEFRSAVSRHDLEGNLSNKRSLGSATKEWVTNTFSGREEFDLVYVAANGWLDRLKNDINASIFDAEWLTSEDYRNEMGTVGAGDVTDAAIEAHRESPNKRLLVHYVQPHAPYVGETAREYFQDARSLNVAQLMGKTNAPDDTLKQAYRDTLDHVIPEVRRLVSKIDGKTVISADHGEMLGERKPPFYLKEYGHPISVYYDELVRIPWFELPFDDRREIISDEPRRDHSRSDEELTEHLRAMGYAE
ncbi:hypothetical protein ACFQJC_03915 [Haloferax namakaokahaiae]|uniref:Sulfatase n=1 Tax=Haloferax namakaokahaiae TaxID=1748331 RepID=A0ABD5ZCB9_9EURY